MDSEFILNRIKKFVEAKGITINRLLSECKLNSSLVSDMQRKGTIPSIKAISKIADYFGVSIDYFLGRNERKYRQVGGTVNFCDRVTQLCDFKNIRISNMCDDLKISRGNITRWKNGTNPTAEKLSLIAQYFNVTVDELLGSNSASISIEIEAVRKIGSEIQVFSDTVQQATQRLLSVFHGCL